jgi:phospholipase C
LKKAAALFVILMFSVSGVVGAQAFASRATPIKHIIFIVQENQTFDHFFGTFPGLAAGYSEPLKTCMPSTATQQSKYGYPPCIEPFNMDSNQTLVQGADIGHTYDAAHDAYDSGLLDGFLAAQGNSGAFANMSMSYLDGLALPDYWDYASYFALDANFFSSSLSYSWPNHLFTVAPTIPPACSVSNCKPEFNLTLPNIVTAMNSTGIDWKFYSGNYEDSKQCQPITKGVSGHSYWNILPDWPSIELSQSTCHRIQGLNDLYNNLTNGYLPQVAWVTPKEGQSDHPGCTLNANGGACPTPRSPYPAGQMYIANIVDMVAKNPKLWASTAIFLTWDDWGGYYDNVLPNQVDSFGYGFRVPLIVISPYVKQGVYYGQTTGKQQDFTAFLATIEANWHLKPMGARDAAVGSLFYMFNFSQTPMKPLILPKNTLATYPLSTCTVCRYGSASLPYSASVGIVIPQVNATYPCLGPDQIGDPCD